MKLRRRTQNLLTLTVALVVIVVLWRLELEPEAVEAAHPHDETPAWIVEEPTIEHFDTEGNLYGRLTAEGMQYHQGDKLAVFQNPQLEQGERIATGWQVAWNATAQQGETLNLGKQIDLIGNVNVYNLLHRYHLQTAELHTNSIEGTLNSQSRVTLTGPDSNITAGSVVANWHKQQIDLTNDVQVTITPR